MKIKVLTLFRNSEEKLDKYFKRIAALEKQHPKWEFEYFFYENDSHDNTVKLLKEWMKDKKGELVSEKLEMPRWGHEGAGPRMVAMAQCREKLLEMARPLDCDWLFLLDSDVVFDSNIIEKYLKIEGPVMYTPNTEHNIDCHMCEPPCKNKAYYDTQALEDSTGNGGMLFTCNPFWDDKDRTRWDKKQFVEVTTAHGGAALVKAEIADKCSFLPCRGWIDLETFMKGVSERGPLVVVPTIKTYTHITNPATVENNFIEYQRATLKDVWKQYMGRKKRNSFKVEEKKE